MNSRGFVPIVVVVAASLLLASGVIALPRSSPLYGADRPASAIAAAGWLSSWWSRLWKSRTPALPPVTPPPTRQTPPAPGAHQPAAPPVLPPRPSTTAPPPASKPPASPFSTFGDSFSHSRQPKPLSALEERYGNRTPFYKKGGVSFEYYWPLDPIAPNISAEETEILVHNESGQPVTMTSVALDYYVKGDHYLPPPGSWEKFASRQSWERTEYRIFNAGAIAPPFQLPPGEKGKLHYHIQFGERPSADKPQSAKINISFTLGGVPHTLDETLTRPAPAAAPPAGSVSHTKQSALFEVPCQSNPDIIFDQTFAPLDQIAGIVPSGAAASEEIKPHSYVDLGVESIPLYAPADLELVEGAYYYEPPTFKVPTTYTFHFQVSCEVILMLDHITDPVAKLKSAFPATPQQGTRSVRVRPTVRLAKGELIGYTKGGGTQAAHINRFDLGLYRTTNTNRFVNQARYERSYTWKYLHAVCPYDYFSPGLREAYYQKFETLNKKPVPGAPCRSPNQDKAGTLAGAWFFRENSFATEAHVGIILELDGSDVEIVGLPRQGVHNSVSRPNLTFKDPAEVRTEHCYFSPHSDNRILYFRLVSPQKAEVYIGTSSSGCPPSFPTPGTIMLYR